MRSTPWLRFGLASSIAAWAGLGATLIGCSSDNGTADADTNAKLTFVNATADLGPKASESPGGPAGVFLCFRQGATKENLVDVHLPPLPENANGMPYGTGGTLPSSLGIDFEPLFIQPIVMNARSVTVKSLVGTGDRKYCDDLLKKAGADGVAGGGLLLNEDYWELEAIAPNTLKKEKAYVVVLTGCTDDATITPKRKCGLSAPEVAAPGRGNLALMPFETERTPASTTAIGVQFLYASTQFDGEFTSPARIDRDTTYKVKHGFAPEAQADSRNGGAFQPATDKDGRADEVLTISRPLAITEPSVTDDTYFMSVVQELFTIPGQEPLDEGIAIYPEAPRRVRDILKLSGTPESATEVAFGPGKNYVFINVGDTSQIAFPRGGSTFNTRSYHFLAFPTDPEVVPYKP